MSLRDVMATASTWHRIYRQTLTLIYKNFLIFYRTPIATIVRALVFPIVFTAIMCVLKSVHPSSLQSRENTNHGAIAPSPTPVLDLNVALKSSSSNRLVFVRNGMFFAAIDRS